MALTPLGFSRSELILTHLLDYVFKIQESEHNLDDLYAKALLWRDAQLCDKLEKADVPSWIKAGHVDWIKRNKEVFDGNDWFCNDTVSDDVFRFFGEYLCPNNCVAVLGSSTFFRIPAIRPEDALLRYQVHCVNLKKFQSLSQVRQVPDFELPPPKFDLLAKPDLVAKDSGFIRFSSAPLVAQKWHAVSFVAARVVILLMVPSHGANVAGKALTEYVNKWLLPFNGERLQVSVSISGASLQASFASSPDDVKAVFELLCNIVTIRSSPKAVNVYNDAVKSLRSQLAEGAADSSSPRFRLDLESVIESRDYSAQMRDLDSLTLQTLPHIAPGYFALLLVGNVRHAQTVELANTVATRIGNEQRAVYQRPLPTVDLPANIYDGTVRRTLLRHSHDGCAVLRAFDLGVCVPGLLGVATALASIASTVLEHDIKISKMYSSQTESKAVILKGHVWFVLEVIGLRELRYVEPKVNRSIFEGMKRAFDELDESDMVGTCGRVQARFFDHRGSAFAEADRMWEPMVLEGVCYGRQMGQRIGDLRARDLRAMFYRHVLNRETRKCVRISYSNAGIVPPLSTIAEPDVATRRRPHADLDDEHAQDSSDMGTSNHFASDGYFFDESQLSG